MTENFTINSRFADPKVDFAFKRIFGTEKYKQATIGLLNSIITDHHVVDVTYLNVELPGLTQDDRKAFIDVLCTDQDGSTFICEMQNIPHSHFLERMVFYSSVLIANNALKGEGWNFALKPTYVVAILNFDIEEKVKLKRIPGVYIRSYLCQEIHTQEKLPASPEYHFVELTKFDKNEGELANDTEKWLFLLSKAELLSEIPESLDDQEPFKAFFEASETAAFTKEEELIYINDMITKWDINCAFEDHEAKGRAEGLAEGRAEGLAEGLAAGREALKETARKLLEKGIPADVVVNCTGLPEDVVASLQ